MGGGGLLELTVNGFREVLPDSSRAWAVEDSAGLCVDEAALGPLGDAKAVVGAMTAESRGRKPVGALLGANGTALDKGADVLAAIASAKVPWGSEIGVVVAGQLLCDDTELEVVVAVEKSASPPLSPPKERPVLVVYGPQNPWKVDWRLLKSLYGPKGAVVAEVGCL